MIIPSDISITDHSIIVIIKLWSSLQSSVERKRYPFDQPNNSRNGGIITQRCFTIISVSN